MNAKQGADPRDSIISHSFINQCVKAADVVCLCLAGLAGYMAQTEMNLAQSLLMSVLAIFPYRMMGANRKVYRWDRYNSIRWETLDVLTGLAAGSAVMWVFAQVFHPGNDIARWFLYWILTALTGITLLRLATRVVVDRLHRSGVLTHRVAMLGAGEEGIAAVEHLDDHASPEWLLRDSGYLR